MNCTYLWPEAIGNFGQSFCVTLTAVTMLVSIPGNIITAFVIIRDDNIRSEPAYLLICSVCLADTLVSTVTQPFYITMLLFQTRPSCLIDRTYFAFAWVSSVSSTLGIINITIDRYVYILHPLHYRIHITKTRARIMIVIVWCIAVLYGIIPNFYYKPLVLHSTTLTILVLILVFMTYAYGKVYSKVTNASNDPPLPTDGSKNNKLKTKGQNQATRTVLLIVIAFFGCWFPWVVVSFLISLFDHVESLKSFTSDSLIMKLHWIFLGFGYSNSALNVFIYSRKNTVLRSAIKTFLGIKSSHQQRNQQLPTLKQECCLITLINQKLKKRRDDRCMTNLVMEPKVVPQHELTGENVASILQDTLGSNRNNNSNFCRTHQRGNSLQLDQISLPSTGDTLNIPNRERTETEITILSE